MINKESKKSLFPPKNLLKFIFFSVIALTAGIYFGQSLYDNSGSNTKSGENLLIYNTNALTPDNKIQVKETYIYDLDKKENRLASTRDTKGGLPDNIKAVYSQSFGNEILFITNIENGINISSYNKSTKLTTQLANLHKSQIQEKHDWDEFRNYSFSQDKNRLIFSAHDYFSSYLYLYAIRSDKVTRITKGNDDDYPEWLNNSQILFWSRGEKGIDSLKTLNLDTKQEKMLLNLSQYTLWNSFSTYTKTSDGEKVIFSVPFSDKKGAPMEVDGEHIMEINIDSRKIKKLFDLPYAQFSFPQITNNSRYIIWSSLAYENSGSASIFSYDLETGIKELICDENILNCGTFHLKDRN